MATSLFILRLVRSDPHVSDIYGIRFLATVLYSSDGLNSNEMMVQESVKVVTPITTYFKGVVVTTVP